jgi:hypothetical protein
MKYLVLLLLFSGCATVYEDGKLVLQLSADATNVTFETPRGTKFHVDTFGPSKTIRAYGSVVGTATAGALPIVTAVMTK